MNVSRIVDIEELIKLYNLEAHPEGGFAQLLYQDPKIIEEQCLHEGMKGSRPIWNAIYYLLPRGSRCVFHRIKMSELWNIYLGGPLELFDISPSGELKKTILGHDVAIGHKLAYVFAKNHWIGAKPIRGFEYSFVSCVTCPGFTFEDWEKGNRIELLKMYPSLSELIISLT